MTNITANRLKEALARKGLKAQDLVNLSGVSKSLVSQYVNAKKTPGNISAGKMAAVLGVSPVWLMGFDVPMIDDPSVIKDRAVTTAYHLEGQEELTEDEKAQVEDYIKFILSKRK